jgi:hypothetical protein
MTEAVLAWCAAASAPPRPVLLDLVPAVLLAERVELVDALLGPRLVLPTHFAGLRCTDPVTCHGKREGALAALTGLQARREHLHVEWRALLICRRALRLAVNRGGSRGGLHGRVQRHPAPACCRELPEHEAPCREQQADVDPRSRYRSIDLGHECAP